MERRRENDVRYRCSYCCGSFHVETGALTVALLYGAVSIACALDRPLFTWPVFVALLNTMPCVLMIFAVYRRQPILYLPFLAFMTFYIVVSVAAVISICIFTPKVLNYVSEHRSDFPKLDESTLLAIALVVFCASAALSALLWSIVFLAYKFAKGQRAQNLPV